VKDIYQNLFGGKSHELKLVRWENNCRLGCSLVCLQHYVIVQGTYEEAMKLLKSIKEF
jgi:hypothetical protein